MTYSSDTMRFDGPFARRLIRGGWWTVAGGAALAFVATAALGQGATSYEELASTAHRASLIIMLVGFVVAMLGYKLRQLARRAGAEEIPPSGRLGDRSAGPFDDLPGAQADDDERRRLKETPPEYTRGTALSATRQAAGDAPLGPENPKSATSPGAARAAIADTEEQRDLVSILRPIAGVTVLNAIGLLFPLLPRPAGPVCSALANWVMAVVLLTLAIRSRGHARVFAITALLPTGLLTLFSLRLIEAAHLPTSWYAPTSELWDVLRLIQLVGWLSIVPLGGLAIAFWFAFSQEAQGESERERAKGRTARANAVTERVNTDTTKGGGESPFGSESTSSGVIAPPRDSSDHDSRAGNA